MSEVDVYYRVSTEKRDGSGPGLEAQRKAVHDYLNECISVGALASQTPDSNRNAGTARASLLQASDYSGCRKKNVSRTFYRLTLPRGEALRPKNRSISTAYF